MRNSMRHHALKPRFAAAPLMLAALVLFICISSDSSFAQQSSPGLGKAVVNTAFGGFILGYDISTNGTEGILAEAGGSAVAVETFDQSSGKILKVVVQQRNTNNDFVAFGIFGRGVGLFEQELSG